MDGLDLTSIRARKARLGKTIGHSGYTALLLLTFACIVGGATLAVAKIHYGYSLIGIGVLVLMPAVWWYYDLRNVPPFGNTPTGRLSGNCLALLKPNIQYSPATLWETIRSNNQVLFITNHLMLSADQLHGCFTEDPGTLSQILMLASQIADSYGSLTIEPAHLATALLESSPVVADILTRIKLTKADIVAVSDWFNRSYIATHAKPRDFGGIGRDWTSGFTPQLSRFGYNVSADIERTGGHYSTLAGSAGVHDMKSAFSQGVGSIALIGPGGIGKTSTAYALAQDVLAEAQDRALAHKQLIALDASAILSAAHRQGELEFTLTMLLNEALHAGNIMLFFDDAQLFFHNGPGSFDATQILLPAIQSRALQIIFAMTPHDYEALRANNIAFAGLLTPVVLREQPEPEIMEILADTASNFESRNHLLITYAAIKTAYTLSGRYETDIAYPGKAIRLLEQSLPHAYDRIVDAQSVEATIQQTRGVRAGAAAPVEADALLHLEDLIHQRMINQSRAVKVVSDALRRARAGVANPHRPIGSFLFLGPTGVGKTELAKAIAATYFGDESRMIRLDMSEYQQDSDVARILSDGQGEAKSLIMSVRQQPFSVVLLDEIEKAHPNILNLMLQLLDEGILTDTGGRVVSFKDAVVIATSNAGADQIRAHIEQGKELEQFESELTDQLISSGQFRPELINRFDEVVLFRPLNANELGQVVRLMLAEVNKTLGYQNISVTLTDAAVARIVEVGNDPRLGARPMRRTLQKAVENTVASKILRREANPGDHITLDANDLSV
ncbi:MAG TPA: AAA family ATPase [Verrucomicrobiae bacterium]|nr:AAA family ATPase [Verrucomicrobiae bacterium]